MFFKNRAKLLGLLFIAVSEVCAAPAYIPGFKGTPSAYPASAGADIRAEWAGWPAGVVTICSRAAK